MTIRNVLNNSSPSLRVVAGTRARHEIRPVDDRNIHTAPSTVAPLVGRFVSQAVDFAEIIDHLFVYTVKVRNFPGTIITTTTLLGQQVKRPTRIFVLLAHPSIAGILLCIQINRHDKRIHLSHLFEQISERRLRTSDFASRYQKTIYAVTHQHHCAASFHRPWSKYMVESEFHRVPHM